MFLSPSIPNSSIIAPSPILIEWINRSSDCVRIFNPSVPNILCASNCKSYDEVFTSNIKFHWNLMQNSWKCTDSRTLFWKIMVSAKPMLTKSLMEIFFIIQNLVFEMSTLLYKSYLVRWSIMEERRVTQEWKCYLVSRWQEKMTQLSKTITSNECFDNN